MKIEDEQGTEWPPGMRYRRSQTQGGGDLDGQWRHAKQTYAKAEVKGGRVEEWPPGQKRRGNERPRGVIAMVGDGPRWDAGGMQKGEGCNNNGNVMVDCTQQ